MKFTTYSRLTRDQARNISVKDISNYLTKRQSERCITMIIDAYSYFVIAMR